MLRNPVLDAIQENRLVVMGDRVLIRAVSVFELAQRTPGPLANIIIAGQKNTEKDVAYFEVLAVGDKVQKVKVGDKVIHVSSAADGIADQFGIVHEDDIIAKIT